MGNKERKNAPIAGRMGIPYDTEEQLALIRHWLRMYTLSVCHKPIVFHIAAKRTTERLGRGAGFCSFELKQRHKSKGYEKAGKPLLQHILVCGLAGSEEEGRATFKAIGWLLAMAQGLNMVFRHGERQIKPFRYDCNMDAHFVAQEDGKLSAEWVPPVHLPARGWWDLEVQKVTHYWLKHTPTPAWQACAADPKAADRATVTAYTTVSDPTFEGYCVRTSEIYKSLPEALAAQRALLGAEDERLAQERVDAHFAAWGEDTQWPETCCARLRCVSCAALPPAQHRSTRCASASSSR